MTGKSEINISFLEYLLDQKEQISLINSELNLQGNIIPNILNSDFFKQWMSDQLYPEISSFQDFSIINSTTIELKKHIDDLAYSLNDKITNIIINLFKEEISDIKKTFEKLISDQLGSLNGFNSISVFFEKNSNESNKEPIINEIFNIIRTTQSLLNDSVDHMKLLIHSIQYLCIKISDISKEVEFEIDTTLNKKLEKEKNIILKDFESKLNELFINHNLKYKDLNINIENLEIKNKNINQLIDTTIKKNEEVNNKISNYDNRIAEIILNEHNALKQEFNVLYNDLKIKCEEKLNEINHTVESAKQAKENFIEIVEKAGIYDLTQNYKSKADEEKKDYVTNRRWTVAAICLAILTTVLIIALPIIEYWNANPPVETNYYTVFARFTVSIMFFVLAVYTSKQAAKHYECYQENHKTYLQLAALEPFISRMNDDDKLNIRKTLVPIYFNQNNDGKFASKGDEVDIPSNIHSIVNRALDIVSERKDPRTIESTFAENKPKV